MTFRASSIITQTAYEQIKSTAVDIRAYLGAQATNMQQATVSAAVPFSVIQALARNVARLDTLAATTGLAAYAQAQESDPTYDVTAEYTSMRNALVSARDQLISMFPKDANGFLLFQSLDAAGNVVYRTFTSAQLAPVVTLLNNAAATIS